MKQIQKLIILVLLIAQIQLKSFRDEEERWRAKINQAIHHLQQQKQTGEVYHALVDAGSSGSRFYIYQELNGIYKDVGQFKSSSVKLANVIANPTDDSAIQQAKDLLGLGQTIINSNPNLKNVKISSFTLLSTAGSRDQWIASKQKDQIKKALEKVAQTVQQNLKGVFPNSDNNVKTKIVVVSGRYEGMYAFLALAYYIKGNDPKMNIYNTICGNKSYQQCMQNIVYYEVGGSSTQVAFTDPVMPRFKQMNRLKNKGQFLLNNVLLQYLGLPQNSSVYSRSFLGNGNNQLYDQYLKNTECNSNGLIQGKNKFYQCLRDITLNLVNNQDRTYSPSSGEQYKSQYQDISVKIRNKQVFVINSASSAGMVGGGNADFFKGPVSYRNAQDYMEKVSGQCAVSGLSPEQNYQFEQFKLKEKNGTITPQEKVLLAEYYKRFGEKMFHLCQAGTLPIFFADRLNMINKQIVLINFSWTVGALVLNKYVNDSAEQFNPINVNQFENTLKDLSKDVVILK